MLLAILTACQPSQPHSTQASNAPRYHCPMHPTYVSSQLGDCPICNMKLVPIEQGAAAATSASAGESPPPGRVAVYVRPEKQQIIGLRTSRVELRELAHTVRASGVVQHDETALATIAPRFAGWIRRLHINFVGQEVQSGQPLLTVYSPELLVAQRDYLLARQSLLAAESTAAASSRLLLDTARQRLRLWEIGDEEIRALEQSGQPSDELLFRAPVTGHVITKRALAGRAFLAGETLFEIGQLSRLWVRAAVVEPDLPAMAVGKKARVIFPQLGDRTLQTTIAFISPHIDPMTRRGEVRLNLDNADLVLRPEMWARVEIELSRGKVLSVPASAVLDTGSRHVAFVRRDDDHLEPRNVMVGMETADFLEIRAGLEEGEAVVTRALFLIDSESQLRAAIAGMTEEPAAAVP